ncbi:MAG TPA: hypothetical protein VG015_03430 [Candidatus Dormibacteraeota bacterium]|jgi:predicted nucleic acid-binding protein|nr:hypothetical protein [Candidatus Dormibacteraeota bacterium]
MTGAGKVPVVVDINVLIDAIEAEPDVASWTSPPPVRGNPAAMVLAILNEGLEFGIWFSKHIHDGTKRVLVQEFGWTDEEGDKYLSFLTAAAERTGGMVEPALQVADCPDWEDNRILELAHECGALIIVSSDAHLLAMSPWRGIPVMTPDAFVARVDAMRRNLRRFGRPDNRER